MASNPTAEGIHKLNDLIKDMKFAMLTTVCHDGGLHSRPMANQKVEFDGTLWFLTRDDSPKTDEIRRAQKVNISYVSPQSQRFVSVSGTAEVIRDQKKSQQLWDKDFETWFPPGVEDPHLCLLKVQVEGAAFWDTPGSPVKHLEGFTGWENKKLRLA